MAAPGCVARRRVRTLPVVDATPTLQVGGRWTAAGERSAQPTSTVASWPRQLAVGVVSLLLAVLAAGTLVGAGAALLVRRQLDEGEPLIYGLGARLLRGEPLYQPLDRQPFIQVHYTPLYYWATAGLHLLLGGGFAPGRALSIVAGLASAGLVAYLAMARSDSWRVGGFAALLFLALGFPGAPAPWLALYRVDVLGVALSLGAIAALAHGTTRRHLVAAGALAGLALLTKQSLFAAAIAGTLWLATLGVRKAALFALATLVTALLPSAALQWSSGGAYLDNIVLANPTATSLELVASLVRELVIIQGVPALLAALFVVRARAWREPQLRLILTYWLASFVSVVGIVKVGSNHNYWIELAAATAVLATLGVWTALRPRTRGLAAVWAMLPVWLFAAALGILTPARLVPVPDSNVVPPGWRLPRDQLGALRAQNGEFSSLVQELRPERDRVLGESLDTIVLADRPPLFEPFAYSMLEQEGRWSSRPLVDDICAGKISLLVLSYPIESDIHPVGLSEFPMWPRTVMRALRATMVFDSRKVDHWLYRPRSLAEPSAAASAGCDRRLMADG